MKHPPCRKQDNLHVGADNSERQYAHCFLGVSERISLARSIDETYQLVAGGGSRVLALLLALTCAISMIMVSDNTVAQAATDRWYRVSWKDGITAASDPGGNSKDTVNYLSNNYDLDYAHATRGIVVSEATGTGATTAPYRGIGLDNDGVAWFMSATATFAAGEGKTAVNPGFRWFPMSTWRFSQIKKGTDGNAYLYGHQLPESSQIPGSSVVAQMPTTGAPEGLSTVGMIAMGLGMLGLGMGLARRRSI